MIVRAAFGLMLAALVSGCGIDGAPVPPSRDMASATAAPILR